MTHAHNILNRLQLVESTTLTSYTYFAGWLTSVYPVPMPNNGPAY